MPDLLANIGNIRPQVNPMAPYLDARQRYQMQNLGNVVGSQLATGQPDKNMLLGELGRIDPVRAMQMSGMDATKQSGARPVSGNMALKIQMAQEAEPLKLQANEIANQAVQKLIQDPYSDVSAEQLQINDLSAKIQTLGQSYRSPIKSKFDQLIKAQGAQLAETKEDRAREQFEQNKKEFGYKVSEEQQDDLSKVQELATNEYYRPELVSFRRSMIAFDKVKSLKKEAESGNPTAQIEFIINMKKMSDSSQVLLSEIGSVTDPSILNKMEGFYAKIASGQNLTPKEIQDAYRTAQSIFTSSKSGYDDQVGGIIERTKIRNETFGLKDWDINKWLGKGAGLSRNGSAVSFQKVH